VENKENFLEKLRQVRIIAEVIMMALYFSSPIHLHGEGLK
jgi:hypothetical protein